MKTRLFVAVLLVLASALSADEIVYRIANGPKGAMVSRVGGDGEDGSPSDEAITRWVEASARAVALYYGRFPVTTRLVAAREPSGKIHGGVTYGGRHPTIHVTVGGATTRADFDSDWVLPHEMIHLALPDFHATHAWLAEGSATYVEPIARVLGGLLPRDDVWKWLLWGLPKGLPGPGDHGLDGTRSWGRTYWGGTLFCLLADVEIRRATGNKKSLGDALRGILEAGGDISTDWTIEETLAAGDRAVGTKVLTPLYAKLARAPGSVDLSALFEELGVSSKGGRPVYDDGAPLAKIRRAISADGHDP